MRIPNPVRATHPANGPSITPTTQDPQNTNNRPHLTNRQVAESMDQLRNYTPISNPGHNHNTRRLATDNDDHPRTAKYWQSTSTADTRHRATNHSAAQTHGPNRKSCADSRSGPHHATRLRTIDHNDSTGTAEYQQSTSAREAINRGTGHQTARAHGPNRRSCTDIPFSPDHTIQHQTTDPLQQHKNRGIPATYQHGRHQPPSRCCLATQIRGLNRESYADSRSSPCHAPRLQAIDQADSLKTAEYQHSTSTLDSSRHTDNHNATQIREPNRKSHTDSESSARPRRPAPDHVQRQHHETAEYQRPTSAADISHLATNHGADQIHGPNRKSLADSRSSPHDTTSQQTTNRDNHQTAEYQHSSNAQKTINRSTGHQTAHVSGPNLKSHTNLGSSPHPSNTTSNRDTSCRQLLTARSCLKTRTKNRDRWNHCHSSYWSGSDCYRSSAD